MTPSLASSRQEAVQSTLSPERTLKRPASLFVESAAKKQRGLVSRTHSPFSEKHYVSSQTFVKTLSTPPQKVRCDVKKLLAPTVAGVSEATDVLRNGNFCALPTESVYMICSSVDCHSPFRRSFDQLLTLGKAAVEEEASLTLLLRRPIAVLDGLLPFKHKPYAIQEKDGKATTPVKFCEDREVLSRLAKKYWPGPLTMYIKSGADDDESSSLPLSEMNGKKFVSVSSPAHPLVNRVMKEVESSQRIMVGTTACVHNDKKQSTYITNASDLCKEYYGRFFSEQTSLHVLNGEDKRELFAVPTCQYGKPYSFSLWIDGPNRTVTIRGSTKDSPSASSVMRAFCSSCSSPSSSDERTKNRNRIITAVLRKWQVKDERVEE